MTEQKCRNCGTPLVWVGSLKDGGLGCMNGVCNMDDYNVTIEVKATDTCNAKSLLDPWREALKKAMEKRVVDPAGVLNGVSVHHGRQSGKTQLAKMLFNPYTKGLITDKFLFDELNDPTKFWVKEHPCAIQPAQHYGLDLAMFPDLMNGAVYSVSVDEEGFPVIQLLEYQEYRK